MQYNIYSDGACTGNPGRGGFAYIVKVPHGTGFLSYDHAEGYLYTTNNRMELMGVISALETVKEDSDVLITTDSTYVVHAINKGWLDNWQHNCWRASNKKPVKNKDLWLRYLKAAKKKNITFKWVRGHSGHEENELCDKMAVNAYNAKRDTLREDTGYLKECAAAYQE